MAGGWEGVKGQGAGRQEQLTEDFFDRKIERQKNEAETAESGGVIQKHGRAELELCALGPANESNESRSLAKGGGFC